MLGILLIQDLDDRFLDAFRACTVFAVEQEDALRQKTGKEGFLAPRANALHHRVGVDGDASCLRLLVGRHLVVVSIHKLAQGRLLRLEDIDASKPRWCHFAQIFTFPVALRRHGLRGIVAWNAKVLIQI